MIATIARKELREVVRDGRFQLASSIVLVLLLASLAAGWKQYADVKAQHDTAQQAERRNWLEQTPKNPHQAAHYGVYAFKPKSTLSMLDTGVDPYVGVSVYLEAHKQNTFRGRPAQDASTSSQRFGELTAAIVLQVLVPLLVILLAFATFAGEREQGTLRHVLSLGVPRKTLVAGKGLGIAAALSVVLGPATVIGVVALQLTSGEVFDNDLASTALMALVYLLYFGVVLALSLAVSARAKSMFEATRSR